MNQISAVMLGLHQRPISYYKIHATITGSVLSGVLLSQVMYWFSASNKNKIYKTDAELMHETMLTENELRGAKKKLKKLKFLTISREGVPAKTFYEIDWDVYFSTLVGVSSKHRDPSSFVKSTELDSSNPQNKSGEIHESITESTQRTPESYVATEVDDEESELSETMVEAIDVAHHLATRLSESIETYKMPTEARLKTWAKDIDRAIRLDGRTKEQLISVIDWIHDHETFWIPNIKSGKKLREQFDVLWFKMQSEKPKVNIRDRVAARVRNGKPFVTLRRPDGKPVELCLYGDANALYDYRRNKYIPKEEADAYWRVIESHFSEIFKEA